MNELALFANAAATFTVTYLLHSTLLLASCWLAIRITRTESHVLAEWLWKTAAVLGVFTAGWHGIAGSDSMFSPQETAGIVDVVWEPDIAVPVESQVTLDAVSPKSGLISDEMLSRNNSYSQSQSDPSRRQGIETSPLGSHVPSNAEIPAADLASNDWLQSILPWSNLATVVLMSCIVVGGMWLAVQSLRLHVRFSRGKLLQSGPARRTLDRFLKSNKIRRHVRLLVSSGQIEPVTYGLFRWTIVLPENTEERLATEELKALLIHELAHLVRGDVWWLWIGRVLCTCLAFQPLNFLARRRWQQAAEYRCDDWAVERGIRSLALAKCLTKIAEWRLGSSASSVGLAAGGPKVTLVRRVERLLKEQGQSDVWNKPLRRSLLVTGAAVAAVGLACFTPRVALPQAWRDSDQASISLPVDGATLNAWRALEVEILQLEIELRRASELLRSSSLPEGSASHIEGLQQRASSLTARRERLTLLFRKDS